MLPKPIDFVNDFEKILTKQEVKELTKIILRHEKKTTNQISIVTVKSISPYKEMFDFSFDLGNYWGVGQKDKNNGVLIVVSKELRKIRIQNGEGIEKILTDEETKTIIDNEMIVEFKNDNYFEGLKKGLESIIIELSK